MSRQAARGTGFVQYILMLVVAAVATVAVGSAIAEAMSTPLGAVFDVFEALSAERR